MSARVKTPKDWACMECGRRMTLKAAERASFGPDGCPKCGGSDIDLYVPPVVPPARARETRCPLRDEWREWPVDKRKDRLFCICPGCGLVGSHVTDLSS